MTDEHGSSDSLPKIRTFAEDLERNRNKKTAKKKADDKTPAKKDKVEKVREEIEPKKPEKKPETKPTKKALIREKSDTKSETTVKPKKAVVASNPPFHTIDKKNLAKAKGPKLDADVAEFEKSAKPEKASVLESVSNEFEIKREDEGGTIISDMKHNRFSFFGEIGKSISQFLHDLGSVFSGDQKNKLSVPKSKRRKGVIQEATSSTGRFATSDHQQVISRLKKRNETNDDEEEDDEDSDKQKSTDKKVEEKSSDKNKGKSVGYGKSKDVKKISDPAHLLEEPDDEDEEKGYKTLQTTKKDTARKIKKIIAIPRKSIKAVVPEVEPVIPEEPEPITVPEVVPEPLSTTTPEEVVEEPTESIQPTSGELNAATAVLADRDGEELILAPSDDEEESDEDDSRFSTNAIAVGTVALIAIVTGATFIAYASYQYINTKLQAVEIETISDFSNFNSKNVPISAAEPTRLLATANEIMSSESEMTVVTPVVRTEGRYSDLLPFQTLSALQINISSNLESTIEEMAYGGNDQGDKFIILVVDNTTDALGGMLSWENTMSEDLAHIFGPLQVSTSTELLPPSFKDFSDESFDLRIIKHSHEEQSLVYGFATANKIIITNNSNTFRKVSAKLE